MDITEYVYVYTVLSSVQYGYVQSWAFTPLFTATHHWIKAKIRHRARYKLCCEFASHM